METDQSNLETNLNCLFVYRAEVHALSNVVRDEAPNVLTKKGLSTWHFNAYNSLLVFTSFVVPTRKTRHMRTLDCSLLESTNTL